MTSGTPFLVEDLLRSPALQLRLLAGERGLGRRVAWAHVSELEDPSPWLTGAELIMTTGLAVPRAERDQVAYLERLDDGGVAALAVSAQLHTPPLTARFIATANERGFPVLEVPLSVPFVAIAQEVAAAVQEDSLHRLNAQLQVFGAVRWMAQDAMEQRDVFARLEQLSGYQLFVSTPSGRQLLEGVPAPSAEVAALVPDSPDAPPSIPGGYALPIPAPGGPAGYLVAIEKPGANPAGLAAVQHIATVAALHLTMRRQEQERWRREGAEILAELLQGQLPDAAHLRRLQRLGFSPVEPLRLLACRTSAGKPSDVELTRELELSDIPYLILQTQTETYLLVPATIDASATLGRVTGLRIGASAAFDLTTSMDVPRREALWAVARAVDADVAYLAYDPATSGRWLVDDAAAVRSLVTHVLGRVIDYDKTHRADLLLTVRLWVERDRQNASVADALHVHPNTVAYRLRRFEELTDRDLNSTADLAEVWLALQALSQLEPLGA